ncbi:MAG: hypothetical protein AAGG09_16545 [Pseudomonadota bacterium]
MSAPAGALRPAAAGTPDLPAPEAAATLDAALVHAHESGDKAVLARLYADAAARADDTRQKAFYLTHAYVFALDAGLADATRLHARLRALGCEE